MKQLYALAVNGVTLYFIGNIPPNNYKDIDNIVTTLNCNTTHADYTNVSECFINSINLKLKIKLEQILVSHVFRIL